MLWPSIAVITPVRNGMPYLPEAVQSVVAQQYPRLKFVLVDDASTDGSGDFARGVENSQVLAANGVGPAAARNLGIQASTSDLVLFLDADDLLGPCALKNAVDALLRTPKAGFAQGYIQNFVTRPDGSPQYFTQPYRFINLGACLWRRTLLQTLGLFDDSLRLGEDQDLFMRCWERDIPRALIDAVTLYYRRHPGNMTHGLTGAGFGLMRVYRNRIDRIRRGDYDPNLPRHTSWADYLGKSPDPSEPPQPGPRSR